MEGSALLLWAMRHYSSSENSRPAHHVPAIAICSQYISEDYGRKCLLADTTLLDAAGLLNGQV